MLALARLLLALLAAPAAAAQAPAPPQGEPAALVAPCRPWIDRVPLDGSGQARRVGDTVCFAGKVDEPSAGRLIAAVREIPADRPMVLVLRSGGGGVLAALDAAEVLLPRTVTAVAWSICASACPNYLMTAADRRVVAEDTVLAWHGGMSPAYLANQRRVLQEEQSRPRPDIVRLAAINRGLRAAVEGGPRQEALLRAAGADPRFFDWFDATNAKPRREWSPDCAARPRAGMIVFSDAFLRARGLAVHDNRGPAGAAALQALLKRRGAPHLACWWE